MNRLRFHSIMSELHRLLGSYSEQEFREAASKGGDLKAVLNLMAEYVTESPASDEIGTTRPSGSIDGESSEASRSVPNLPDDIEYLLRNNAHVVTNFDLEAIAATFNLGVRLPSKDGKNRNTTKLAKAIAAAPPAIRRQIIRDLSKEHKSDTQGWLDVIRRRK